MALTAPLDTELEVTLLGPGLGECQLIHLGAGNWVVVDSCIDSHTSQPAAIAYLERIGVDPRKAVKLVVATHWHDDHIRGLSEVLECCSDARFCCSVALCESEFVAAVLKYEGQKNVAGGPGVREIRNIYKILEERSSVFPPIKALADRVVYQVPEEMSGHGRVCRVWTLSPSDEQLEKFYVELTNLMPSVKETKRRAVPQDPNHVSIATLVEVGEHSILLGGDLEETGNPLTGWSMIVSSQARPQVKSSVFKIPHHGSENAHCDDVWATMLEDNPLAILTPYNRGVKKRPSQDDVARISYFTENGYSTAQIKVAKTKKKRERDVEKMINDVVGKIRAVSVGTGMIRLRRNMSDLESNWDVELFDGACDLSKACL